jgi:hypothetical protein
MFTMTNIRSCIATNPKKPSNNLLPPKPKISTTLLTDHHKTYILIQKKMTCYDTTSPSDIPQQTFQYIKNNQLNEQISQNPVWWPTSSTTKTPSQCVKNVFKLLCSFYTWQTNRFHKIPVRLLSSYLPTNLHHTQNTIKPYLNLTH